LPLRIVRVLWRRPSLFAGERASVASRSPRADGEIVV
jgi:hypothetical protein